MRQLVRVLVFLFLQFGYITFTHGQAKSEVLGSPNAIVYDMKLIQEKDLLIANLADKIELWNLSSKTLVNSWSASQIIAIAYFNNRLAGVSKSGNIVIWNIPTGKEYLHLTISASPLICVCWIDSTFIAIGSDNGDILKINSVSGEIVAKVKNAGSITAIALGQGNTLITGNEQGILSTYGVEEMRLQNSVKGHKSWIREIKASDTSQFFITVSDDGFYKKWKSGKQIILAEKEFLGNWLLSADFSDYRESKSNFSAVGKRNGDVVVHTRPARYTSNLNSLINSIAIIKNKFPLIALVVGTHGNGIQLLNAKGMKIKIE